jgi:hypothetical protein
MTCEKAASADEAHVARAAHDPNIDADIIAPASDSP